VGLDIPIWADGRNILNPDFERTARYIHSSNLIGTIPDLAAVRIGNRVVIGNPQEVSPVMYDLRNDPNEINPLVPGRETVEQLFYYWSLPPKGNPPIVSFGNKIERKLQYLGYFR
jgi:hypothetical protein